MRSINRWWTRSFKFLFQGGEREEEGRKFDSGKRYEFAAVLAGIGGGRDVGIRGIYTVGSRYIRGLGFDLHLGP